MEEITSQGRRNSSPRPDIHVGNQPRLAFTACCQVQLWTNHQGPIFVYTILYTIASLAMIIVK
jgi:hypothetical protein